MNKKHALILSMLITLLIGNTIYLLSLAKTEKRETIFVSRVIDGDTIKLPDSSSLRLVNINSPEKDNPLSLKSFNFLRKFENTTISAEFLGKDKYGRTLARLYSKDGEYINLEIVKEGLASKFLVQKEETKVFNNAEKEAIEKSKGIWNKSIFFGCIKTKIDKKLEIVKIENLCSPIFFGSWTLKDESRKIYYSKNIQITKVNLHSESGEDNETDIFWNQKSSIWNNDRDSLYLFDNNEKIVHYDSYGY